MSDTQEPSGLLSFSDADEEPVVEPIDSELMQLRQLGRDLVNYTFMSLRTMAMHSTTNEAVRLPVERLGATIEELSKLVNTVHLIAVEGQVYLNDLRIRMESAAFENVRYLVEIFDRHGIGGISFERPPADNELRELLLLLLQYKPSAEVLEEQGGALAGIRQALEQSGVGGVKFDQQYYYKAGATDLGEDDGDGVEASEQEGAALAYAKGVLAVKDYFRAVEAAEAANPLRIRKIVQDLVDVADVDSGDFLRLHTIHGVEDNYYNHCVNVASLAVALGRYLGLSRVELAELGAAAMFHDVGYAVVEKDSLARGEELSAEDRRRLHAISGFKALLRQTEYGPALMRRLLVNLEHHMHYSRPGGYPNLGNKSLSVYTRILQVADHYDALVTPVEDIPGLLPVQALDRIVAASGEQFDPVVVKALVHVVGRYPYGSLVELNTGEVGVVTSGGRTPEAFNHPLVMIVRNADGSVCDPREVDLFEAGVLKRRITEVLDPYTRGITPHAVLFSDLKETQDRREAAETKELGAVDDDVGVEIDDGVSEEEARLAAWNEAVSRGDDPVAATTGTGWSTLESTPLQQDSDDGDESGASEPEAPPAAEPEQEPVVEMPADEEPAAALFIEEEPAEEEPAEGEPAEEEPADEEPADEEPADEEPSAALFVEEEPEAPPAAEEDQEDFDDPWIRELEVAEPGMAAEEAAADAPMSPEEEARRKAAWKKAMARAFSKGGEEAVAELARMDWRDFGDES